MNTLTNLDATVAEEDLENGANLVTKRATNNSKRCLDGKDKPMLS